MKISYSGVEQDCNRMHQISGELKIILNDIKSKSGQINSAWDGDASNYFLKMFDNLTKNFDDITNELDNCVLFMAECSDGYQKIDSKIMNDICNSLNITEPGTQTSKIFPTKGGK